jgi:hypothetical protein
VEKKQQKKVDGTNHNSSYRPEVARSTEKYKLSYTSRSMVITRDTEITKVVPKKNAEDFKI